ncbi:MAG: TonB-dependent receptor, partial [Planctomycetota bacterium]
VWVYISPFTISPVNAEKIQSRGVETSLRLRFGKIFSFHASYTYLSTQQTHLGTQLPGRPEHTARLEGRLRWQNFQLFSRFRYSHRIYLDILNQSFISPSYQWDLGLEWKISKEAALSMECKNLLNDTIRDQRGFPLPGRSFYFKLSFLF